MFHRGPGLDRNDAVDHRAELADHRVAGVPRARPDDRVEVFTRGRGGEELLDLIRGRYLDAVEDQDRVLADGRVLDLVVDGGLVGVCGAGVEADPERRRVVLREGGGVGAPVLDAVGRPVVVVIHGRAWV